MRYAKRAIALLLVLAMAVSCLCMTALAAGDDSVDTAGTQAPETETAGPGAQGPGAGGPGAGGPGAGGPGGGGQGESAPVYGTYTCGGMELVLNEDGTFTLNGVEGTYTAKENFSPYGKVTSAAFDEDSVALLKDSFAWYWKGSVTLKDGTFTPEADASLAMVPYTQETVKDGNSVTGYTTTITVADNGYENVYAYGSWMACKLDGSAQYAPEDWENGMYYSGESAILMELDGEKGVWTLTLPLASSNMGVQCYHDLVNASDVSSERISDSNKFPVPYDAEKQSDSFDWTPTFANETAAGTLDRNVEVDSNKLSVYTPYGYDANRAEPYPVLYLVPGGGTTYTTWFDGGLIHNIFDNLTAEGKVEPTILVSMELTAARGGSEAPLVTSIIDYIEANYNASTDAADRAVVGTSMGGAAVTGLWLDEEANGLFSYYGFFSGADTAFKDADYTVSGELLKLLGGATIAIGGGTTDFNMFDGDNNSASISQLDAWMTKNGIGHSYAVVGGGHSWTTWTQLVIPFAEKLWKTENVEVLEGETYTYGGMKLVLADDGRFTLNGVSGTYEKAEKFSPYGKVTTVTFDDESAAALKDGFAWYWKGSVTLKDGSFTPDADAGKAMVEYTQETVKDGNSVTGYTTTITVADNGYENVYAYGSWMASKMEGNEQYAPEDWENGMYYSGESAILMELDGEKGVWTLTLPLASSNMGVQCYHDLVNASDVSSERISDNNKFPIPYDAEKQSESFDWTPTFANETAAGKLDTSIVLEDVYVEDIMTHAKSPVRLSVYTPYGYDANRAEPYPVLYLVPGGGTTYTTWFDGGLIHNIFDNLIAEGKVEPTILVSMELTAARGGSEAPLVTDIIDYIETNYNASTDAADRAVVGTSMGGAAVTDLWLDEEANGLFSYYGFFSGADTAFKDADYTVSGELLKLLGGATIAIGGGTTDFNMFDGDNNSASISQLDAWMTKNGIGHSYAVVGGGHSWTTWTQLVIPFIENLWAAEEDPVVPDDPAKPSEPSKPTAPTSPEESVKPAEPSKPTAPASPADTTKPGSPDTGDESMVIPYIMVFFAAAVCAAALQVSRKKQR